MKKSHKVVVLIFFIPLVLVSIWFRRGFIMGSGESGLPFYNLAGESQSVKHAWSDTGLGNIASLTTSSQYFYDFFAGLENMGISSYVLQALLFYLIFIAAGTGVYLLIRSIFPKMNPWVAFIAVLFYWSNPLALVVVWNRFLYNFMLFWALVPIASYLFYKGLIKQDSRYAVSVGLVSVLFSYSLSSPAFVMLLWGILALFAAFYFYVSKKRTLLFVIAYGLIALLSFIFCNFWWISQLFRFAQSSAYESSISLFFSGSDNLKTLHELSERIGKIPGIFRFMHPEFYAEMPWASFYQLPPAVFLSYVPSVMIVYVFITTKKNKKVIFLTMLFLLSIFLMKGSNPPFEQLFTIPFTQFSILQAFRNPFEKFSFMMMIFGSVLFSYAISKIYALHAQYRRLIIPTIIALISLYAYPFITGQVFSSAAGYNNNQLQGYEVKVPDYYHNANTWLREHANGYRTLVLPLGGEGITYTWPESYSGVELSNAIFDTPVISFITTIPFYYDVVDEIRKYQLTEKVLEYLELTNTKFILLRDDIDYRQRRMPNPALVQEVLSDWERSGYISKQFHDGAITIYEVSDHYVRPKVYFADSVISSNESTYHQHMIPLEHMPNNYVSVSSNDRDLAQLEVITPIQSFTYNGKQNEALSSEELMARLPYVKHMPGSHFYPFIRLREMLHTPPQTSTDAWLTYKVEMLGKRAVEIYKLYVSKDSHEIVPRLENEYIAEVNTLLNRIAPSSMSQYITETIQYQTQLLQLAGSPAWREFENYFVEAGIKPMFPIHSSSYYVQRFNITHEGIYTIRLDRYEGDVYVDGTIIQDDHIFLPLGMHEIATITDSNKNMVLQKTEEQRVDHTTELFVRDFPKEPSRFKVEFEYQFLQGEMVSFQLLENINYENSPALNLRIYNGDTLEWKKFETDITPAIGAIQGKFILNIPDKNTVVSLRNVKFIKHDYPEVILTDETQNMTRSSSFVQQLKEDPTSYTLSVSKSTPYPELLVFSELFDSGWHATYLDTGETIPRQVLVNMYANGWLVERKGEYDIKLTYTSEEGLEQAKMISVSAIAISILAFAMLTIINRKHYA